MKRPRSESLTAGSEGESNADSASSSTHGKDSDEDADPLQDSVRSTASSSPTSDSEVDFGEDPIRDPMLPLLLEVLAVMQPTETFGDMLRRITTSQPSVVARLTTVHSDLLKQHDLVLMSMSREAVLQRALSEAARTKDVLPSVWLLRWDSAPAAIHGLFPPEEMQRWSAGGFFTKKAAHVKNANAPGAVWVPAQEQFPLQS